MNNENDFDIGYKLGVKEAQGKIQRLTKALEYYADESNYDRDFCIDNGDCTPIIIDSGEIARGALS